MLCYCSLFHEEVLNWLTIIILLSMKLNKVQLDFVQDLRILKLTSSKPRNSRKLLSSTDRSWIKVDQTWNSPSKFKLDGHSQNIWQRRNFDHEYILECQECSDWWASNEPKCKRSELLLTTHHNYCFSAGSSTKDQLERTSRTLLPKPS
mgnify:CR=1 FL=1